MDKYELIEEKSFQDMIESVGCKFILANIESGLIAVYCKAKSQNNIVFKIMLNENECVDLINSYGLYKKEKITQVYQDYLRNLNQNLEV